MIKFFDKIRADISRKNQVLCRDDNFLNKMRLLFDHGTLAVIVYRFGSWSLDFNPPLLRHLLLLFYTFLKIFVMMFAGIKVQARAKIGKGFVILNFSGIFVGAGIIGDNFTVTQNVTIGHIRGATHRPIIGSNVYLGPGCKVLGAVKIGSNVRVEANTLVIDSVPDNSIVIGVPGRVLPVEAKKEDA